MLFVVVGVATDAFRRANCAQLVCVCVFANAV